MEKNNKIRDFVNSWNTKFPLDLWWRRKHNVAFMSEHHKSISFLDQLFEWEEERMLDEILEGQHQKEESSDFNGTISKEEIDRMSEEFDELEKDLENGR